MSLDHGMLNLPLSKRGDIDAQLDRYKRDRAAEASAARKARATETRELKAQARQALAEIKVAPGLVDAKAANLGVARRDLVAQLGDWAKWQPEHLIKLRKQWIEKNESR